MNTYPAKTLEGDECAVILNWFVARYGVPDEIVTDNGGQFINNHLKYLMELMQVQHIKITPYSHEENGIVARVNKEVMRHLRNIIFNVKVLDNWAAYLPFAERIINSSKHSDTGRSPAELVFGQAVDLQRNIYNLSDRLIEAYKVPENLNEWEIWAREKLSEQQIVIEAAREYQMRNIQSRMNKKAIEDPTVFEVGSLVLRKHPAGRKHKLAPNLLGPYRVESFNDSEYILADLLTGVQQRVHVSQLKLYRESERIDPTSVTLIDDNLHVVERIVSHRTPNGRPLCQSNKTDTVFTVKWLNYDDSDNTDETWKQLRNTIALHEYLRQLNLEKLIPRAYQ